MAVATSQERYGDSSSSLFLLQTAPDTKKRCKTGDAVSSSLFYCMLAELILHFGLNRKRTFKFFFLPLILTELLLLQEEICFLLAVRNYRKASCSRSTREHRRLCTNSVQPWTFVKDMKDHKGLSKWPPMFETPQEC